MYVKSVVIDGFKSYGRRTEVNGFDPQFNAITGLNGSGKSNVLDAICFVMGITNLTQVRAKSLQDLIYRSGQAGVKAASVSITFDNSNASQSPTGFNNMREITITRQIQMGGKTKYLINGSTVTNAKVNDLFRSVHLNVNNAHFLIMQGKVTKVLNMKASEILAMVEEAAGTMLYVTKKEHALKAMKKKDAKLLESSTIINEDVMPKLEKLRDERAKEQQLQLVQRELHHMLKLLNAWNYLACQKTVQASEQDEEAKLNQKERLEEDIEDKKEQITTLETRITAMAKLACGEEHDKLLELEGLLKAKEEVKAQGTGTLKSAKDAISREEEKLKHLSKSLNDTKKTLTMREKDFSNFQSEFQKLKDDDENDNSAFATAQKRYEALSAGMDLNDDGEAETLLDQAMKARDKVSEAQTEIKQTTMQINHCSLQLKEKQSRSRTSDHDFIQLNARVESGNKEVIQMEAAIKKVSFNEGRLLGLQDKQRVLVKDVRGLRERVDRFEMQNPNAVFQYRDPVPNFNRKKVIGMVCRLITVTDERYSLAVETVAGGRLYQVVVDNDSTSKLLIEGGDLQRRTTFVPINQMRRNKPNPGVIQFAKSLVGDENVESALAYIKSEKEVDIVMESIFGDALICKDTRMATQLAFHPRIKRRCVTLDGDIVDPAGTLSGGVAKKGEPLLRLLAQIHQCENELNAKEKELRSVEYELNGMTAHHQEYTELKRKLDIKQSDVNLLKNQLLMTSQYKYKEEIANLQTQLDALSEKIKISQIEERKWNEKLKELEGKIDSSKGGSKQQLKQAETEMNKLKMKAEKSREQWKKKEEEYETLNLEIEELKKELENTQQQIDSTTEGISAAKENIQANVDEDEGFSVEIKHLKAEINSQKGIITAKSGESQRLVQEKDQLQGGITQNQRKIKEINLALTEIKEKTKQYKAQLKDCSADPSSLKEAEKMSVLQGKELEKKIRKSQETKQQLSRTRNPEAQRLLQEQEKEYDELLRKRGIVISDKKSIIIAIKEYDNRREQFLEKAYRQISKNFGSIFSTLLPGALAKLVPPAGQTIYDGLEVKVSLGGVWKDSLTELSGGQRSLAALSLILAMLMFKPAPLYILDEVDAALDLSHTQNIGAMLKSHFKQSQFIIVSLKNGMFNNANVLFKTQFVDGMSTINRTVNKPT